MSLQDVLQRYYSLKTNNIFTHFRILLKTTSCTDQFFSLPHYLLFYKALGNSNFTSRLFHSGSVH